MATESGDDAVPIVAVQVTHDRPRLIDEPHAVLIEPPPELEVLVAVEEALVETTHSLDQRPR